MLIYLDMCCPKRPFDDQTQPRIRLESEAVLAVLAAESENIRFVRSTALIIENAANPVKERAARVDLWLRAGQFFKLDGGVTVRRAAELWPLGLKTFDALHLASGEQCGADCLATCDDRLVAAAKRCGDRIKIRVVGILELAREILE